MTRSTERKQPTASNVAALVGVSKWTVIRAFKPDAMIADETRKKVLEAARALNYEPNLLAKSLATNKSNQVAILVDDFDNPFKLPALAMLTNALQNRGLLGVLLNVNDGYQLETAVSGAYQRRFDAIVLFAVSYDSYEGTDLFKNMDIPSFVLARESLIDSLPSISTNADSAMAEICAHLVDRGYRRPGFMYCPKGGASVLGRRRRFRAFWKNQMGKAPVEIKAESYSWDASATATRAYLNSTGSINRCDVLMCENDILALGALEVARSEFRLSIPDDLAIVGFDGIALSSLPSFDLTTYRQPIEKMIDILVEMIAGVRPSATTFIDGELVVGSTT